MKKFQSFINKKKIDLILTALALAIGIYFKWNPLDILVFLIFIWIIMNPYPSKYFASVALVLLMATPFLLILKKESLAEKVAIYAYYFLVFTVIMAFYELKKEPEARN